MVRNIYVYVYTNFPYRMKNTLSHSYLPGDGEGLLISWVLSLAAWVSSSCIRSIGIHIYEIYELVNTFL